MPMCYFSYTPENMACNQQKGVEQMAKYIDAELVKRKYSSCGYLQELSEEEFDSIPAADVAPVVHGRWKSIGADKRGRGAIYECSACSGTYPYVCKFCPICGAKMDLKEEK